MQLDVEQPFVMLDSGIEGSRDSSVYFSCVESKMTKITRPLRVVISSCMHGHLHDWRDHC